MPRLKDKIAIVTGATGGIGLAATRCFAAEGAQVVLVDLGQAKLDAAVADIGAERTSAVAADVSDPEQTRAYVDAAMARHERSMSSSAMPASKARSRPSPTTHSMILTASWRSTCAAFGSACNTSFRRWPKAVVAASSLPHRSVVCAARHESPPISPPSMPSSASCARPRSNVRSSGSRVNTINPGPIATRMIEALEEGYAPSAPDLFKEKNDRHRADAPLRAAGGNCPARAVSR